MERLSRPVGSGGEEKDLRILLLGATGLIGSAVAARLADGHEVIGVARSLGAATHRLPVSRWIRRISC